MNNPEPNMPVWTFSLASGSLPLVRQILRSLRDTHANAVRARRLVRKSNGSTGDLADAEAALDKAKAELVALGVQIWHGPARGIALFPTYVDLNGERRAVRFVYYDTRKEIEHYVFMDELTATRDLATCQRYVPTDWKKKARKTKKAA